MLAKTNRKRRCITCKELFTPTQINLRVPKRCLDCNVEAGTTTKVKTKLKKKVKTLGALKKDLWGVFSLHQKLVHSVDGEWCNCYTCEKPIKIGSADCHGGHCMSKAANPAIYFDERAVRPQCYKCNVHFGGQHVEFCEQLKQEIGIESFREMYKNRKVIAKRTRDYYETQIEYYKKQNAQLKIIRG